MNYNNHRSVSRYSELYGKEKVTFFGAEEAILKMATITKILFAVFVIRDYNSIREKFLDTFKIDTIHVIEDVFTKFFLEILIWIALQMFCFWHYKKVLNANTIIQLPVDLLFLYLVYRTAGNNSVQFYVIDRVISKSRGDNIATLNFLNLVKISCIVLQSLYEAKPFIFFTSLLLLLVNHETDTFHRMFEEHVSSSFTPFFFALRKGGMVITIITAALCYCVIADIIPDNQRAQLNTLLLILTFVGNEDIVRSHSRDFFKTLGSWRYLAAPKIDTQKDMRITFNIRYNSNDILKMLLLFFLPMTLSSMNQNNDINIFAFEQFMVSIKQNDMSCNIHPVKYDLMLLQMISVISAYFCIYIFNLIYRNINREKEIYYSTIITKFSTCILYLLHFISYEGYMADMFDVLALTVSNAFYLLNFTMKVNMYNIYKY